MLETLNRRKHLLADPARQRERLEEVGLPGFAETVARRGSAPLHATSLDTLQVNVGRRCNQVCAHCHVDAGPDRREVMTDAVLEACLALLATGAFVELDITGGAPELYPRFAELVERASGHGVRVIHRCNLTAIRLPAYRHLPGHLARHRVAIIASLPAIAPDRTDAQRGGGVFAESIASMRELNALGYGLPGTGLELDLVSNPVGTALPCPQPALECQFRTRLREDHAVEFNRLLALNNMPISRFLEWLDETGELEEYMRRLADAFNPDAAAAVMCRTVVSVGPDGRIFDCDFNQMLELGAEAPGVLDLEPGELVEFLRGRAIRTGPHCYGCAAGAGSSCQGAVA